jgi:2-polyprenyl-3-methyl-5-hydroxy-6-metoxy-1,4-benzoquinol methylase
MADSTDCVLCRGTGCSTVFVEDGIDIVRCTSCGHVYSTWSADARYDGYWNGHAPDDERDYWERAHAAMYAAFRERFLEGTTGRLLDVGCGLGFFVQAAGKVPGWQAEGWEISVLAARWGVERLGVRIATGPLEDAGFARGSFDLVTLWDVIEHLADPHATLGGCRDLLRDGGRLFLHTPNVDVQLPKARLQRALGLRPATGWLQPRDHLQHWSPATIRRLLEQNGFVRPEFHHLPPIQSVGGGRTGLATVLKNGLFQTARAVSLGTAGRVNLDNLFAMARKA